ncbi:uncharacterized protein CTHT_0059520 [Thermochaetoides thermophila DSM 1495]|uniref:HhH-GPD domain-containing protein n=1 Tax=Chaetomium thermophilum (strain DSM 1495 / CBS 144.50 / IMI 039719) TaxID=759272 RepID=G0SES3_CHATD|nr:hypothetical protein CTHT_0059520 [Thermochaetoides thermophila DSM 1495]EGS17939.1 hypothetical protein CTHT_0059520 [Thermochaetoides thermophila DSM 1495]
MTDSPTLHIDDLLYSFNVQNDNLRQFLCDLLASGKVPLRVVDELKGFSLMRGVEGWEMIFEATEELRQRDGKSSEGDDEAGREHKEGEKRKLENWRQRRFGREVSHFFGDDVEENGRGRARRCKEGHRERSQLRGSGCVSFETLPYGEEATDMSTEVKTEQAEAPAYDRLSDNGLGSDPALDLEQTQDISTDDQGSAHLLSPHSTSRTGKESSSISRSLRATKSPFFVPLTPSPNNTHSRQLLSSSSSPHHKRKRPPRGTVSSLPIPPLSSPRFGLIQEDLADDPFALLIAVTFLIRTTARQALPVFRQLMARWPTPEALASADEDQIVMLIKPLGLSQIRCAAIKRYARRWVEMGPPSRERRYGVVGYPEMGDGVGFVKMGEDYGPEDDEEAAAAAKEGDVVTDAKRRGVGYAWEIGYLTQGAYAIDSWRIFCRDVLLGRSKHWTGWGSEREGFQPEWMRVLPKDKELRACLRWMWMKEGWEWDPVTGEKQPLREELRRAVDEGRVRYDDLGNLVIVDEGAQSSE